MVDYRVVVVELLMFIINAYGLGYDLLCQSERGEGLLEYRGYGGKFKFLTFWSEVGYRYKLPGTDGQLGRPPALTSAVTPRSVSRRSNRVRHDVFT